MTRNTAVRVCIIGAGVSGLTSAKYLQDEGINFTLLEATQYVGGTWRYDDRIGTDEYGQPLYTSMYKHLRTNLPKAVMELRDFPISDDVPGFPSGKVYYDYLKSYTKHFNLEKYIKFLHSVSSVKRINNIWKVKYEHIPTGNKFEDDFEFIIVATGHHSKPQKPTIQGESLFKGTIIHSHDFRDTDPYKNRRVLVVGAGPSGMDISLEIACVSETVIHSHHSDAPFRTLFPQNYVKKPDVKEFNETGVVFVDGTFEDIDDVIYCSGYEYYYPFLDESCGLSITSQSVTPLYKCLVNINEPTMIIMGAVRRACVVVAIEAQAAYAAALIKGNFTLPTHKRMMKEWNKHYNAIRSSGYPLSHIHFLAEKENQYYAELSNQAGIFRVPPVVYKIRTVHTQSLLENLYTYRNYDYKVTGDKTFTRTFIESESYKISDGLQI